MISTVLSTPYNCVVLMVHVTRKNCEFADRDGEQSVNEQFQVLKKMTDLCEVPRFAAYQDDYQGKPMFVHGNTGLDDQIFSYQRDQSIWSDMTLFEQIKPFKRDRLFLCGFWLDDVLPAAALEAITLGFDAHIITDLCLASSKVARRNALDRLVQYSVSPISLRGLTYEWMIKTEDEDVRSDLEKLWDVQKAA